MELANFEWPQKNDPEYYEKIESIEKYLNERCVSKFHKDLAIKACVIAEHISYHQYSLTGHIVKDSGALLGAIWSALYAAEMRGD